MKLRKTLTFYSLFLLLHLLEPTAFAGFKKKSAVGVEGEVAAQNAYPGFRKLADQLTRQLLVGARDLGANLSLKGITLIESDQSNLMVDYAAGKQKQQLKVAITSRFIRDAFSEFFAEPEHKEKNFLLGVQRLGGALSHEVGHVLDPKTYDPDESQLQESMADQHGMELLRASHLPPQWMHEAIQSLHVHSSHDRDATQALFGSHPDHEVRLSHLRLYSTWDRFQKGSADKLPPSFDFLPLKNHSDWHQELEQFKKREGAVAAALAERRKPTLEEFEESLKDFEANTSSRVQELTQAYLSLHPSNPNLRKALAELREKNRDLLAATEKILFPNARWQALAEDAKKTGQDQTLEWKKRAADLIQKSRKILELRTLILHGGVEDDMDQNSGFKPGDEWAREAMEGAKPKLLEYQKSISSKNPVVRQAILLKDLNGLRNLHRNWYSKKERGEWLLQHYYPVHGGDPGFQRAPDAEATAAYLRHWTQKNPNQPARSLIEEINESEAFRSVLDLQGDPCPELIGVAKWMDAHRETLLTLELGYLRPRGLDRADYTGVESYHFPWKKCFELLGKDPTSELKALAKSARKIAESKDFWKTLQRHKRMDRRQRYDPFLASEKPINRERLPFLPSDHEYTNGLKRLRVQADGRPMVEDDFWPYERYNLGPGYDFRRPEWSDHWESAHPTLDPRLDLKWNGRTWTTQTGVKLEVDDAALRETLAKTPDRFHYMIEEFKNPPPPAGKSLTQVFPRQMGEDCSLFRDRLEAWEHVRKRWNFNYSPLFWRTRDYGDTIFWVEERMRPAETDRSFFEAWVKQGNLSKSDAHELARCLVAFQTSTRGVLKTATPSAEELMRWIAENQLIPLESQLATLKDSDSRLYEAVAQKNRPGIERQIKELIRRAPPVTELINGLKPVIGSSWQASAQDQALVKLMFAELLEGNRFQRYSKEDQVRLFEEINSKFDSWSQVSPSALSDQLFQTIFAPDFHPPRPKIKPFEKLEFKHFPGAIPLEKIKDWLKRGFFFNPLLSQELVRYVMDEDAQSLQSVLASLEGAIDGPGRKKELEGFFRRLDELTPQPSQEKDDLLEKYAWEFQILDPAELKEIVTARKISQVRVSNPSNRSGFVLNLVSGLARTLSNWSRTERAEAFKAMIDPMDEAAFKNLVLLVTQKAKGKSSLNTSKLERDLEELQKVREYLQKSSPIQRLPLLELLLNSGKEPIFSPKTSLGDPLLAELVQTYLKYDGPQAKILSAYLRSIPDHEKGPALAYLFAMFQKKGDGMKSMFEIFSTVGVKTGQLISIWKFFGEEVSQELGDLKGDAQPINQMDMEALLDTLRTQLGKDEFDRIASIRPLGSASLKTVLQIRYQDGHPTKVAHIHRPFAKPVVQSNLAGARRFLKELHQEGFEKESRALEMLLLVVEEQLKDEQDPALEKVKTQRAGVHYGTFERPRLIEDGPSRGWKVSVPQFYSESEHTQQVKATHRGTEPDVHLMEFADGITLASARNPNIQAKHGITPHELAQANFLAVDIALDSLFKSGQMNADGHTGNYLVNFKKKELYPIDFGQFEMGHASGSPWLRDDPYLLAQLLQVFAAVPQRPEGYAAWNAKQKEDFWRPWCERVLKKAQPLARNQNPSEREKQEFTEELVRALLQNPSVDPKMMVTSTLLKSALNPRKEIFGFLKGLLILSEENYVSQEVFQTLLAQKIKTLYLDKFPCTAADAASGYCSQVWEKCVEKATEALKAVESLNLGDRVKSCF